jgi:hypothetical protein
VVLAPLGSQGGSWSGVVRRTVFEGLLGAAVEAGLHGTLDCPAET